jgi:hypothetical protein
MEGGKHSAFLLLNNQYFLLFALSRGNNCYIAKELFDPINAGT